MNEIVWTDLSSDDESTGSFSSIEDEMSRLERDDPTLTALVIGFMTPRDGDEWERFGRAIGGNNHLEDIHLCDWWNDGQQEFLPNFLRGVALNQSVRALFLNGWDVPPAGEILDILIKFFRNNQSFEYLEAKNSRHVGNLRAALRSFDSLKEFKLDDHQLEEIRFPRRAAVVEADAVVEGLIGHTDLMKITLCGINMEIRRRGCVALRTLLQNPRSNLEALHLDVGSIDDEGADMLASGLSRNTSLKELEISCPYKIDKITDIGWQTIFAGLRNSMCRLESLHLVFTNYTLAEDYVNDAVALSLSSAVRRHITSLKSLDLCIYNTYDSDITIAGWRAFFPPLRRRNCVLEKLYLSGSSITDEGIYALTNALVNNSRLRELALVDSLDVTATGWLALSTVIRDPDSGLETLDLSGSDTVNDDVAISFADALTNNSRLNKLELITKHFNNITSDGWAALAQILCNRSSILSTYHSNHTLEHLSRKYDGSYDDSELPKDLRSHLRINRENSVSEAARLKIIGVHFTGSNINTSIFTAMKLKVLPIAIAWMGRDSRRDELSDVLFAFLRSLPLLCDTRSNSKKRKWQVELR